MSKERYVTLAEIAEEMAMHEVADGTKFVDAQGNEVVVQNGSILHVTQSGYATAPVGFTAKELSKLYKEVVEVGESVQVFDAFAFGFAVASIIQGDSFNFYDGDGEKHTVSSLDELDAMFDLVDISEIMSNNMESDPKTDVRETIQLAREYLDELENAYSSWELRDSDTDTEEDVTVQGLKLTSEDVYEIHELRSDGFTVGEIADIYDITPRMVYYILDGTYWADIFKKVRGGNR